MLIRAETEADRLAVHALITSAFESSSEAQLVDALRRDARPVVSLVAEDDSEIVGYIMFSPVALSGHSDIKVMGLAPMAVTPERQRQGVGSALVRAGLERCRQLGCGAVVVLGHPEYYPRFGFRPSTRFAVGCEYDVPEEVFMAMELQPGYLRGVSGTIRYHAAFGSV